MSTAGVDHGKTDLFLLGCLPAGRILNAGAGATQALAGVTVVNVDHVPPSDPTGLCVVGDVMRLPFRDEVFAGALLKDILEHLQEPIDALTEAYRVVEASGALIVQVPRAIPRAVWADPTHIRGFTDSAISTALRISGWQAERPRKFGGFPGAGRLGLIPYLSTIMRVPGVGHYFGLNWLVRAGKD